MIRVDHARYKFRDDEDPEEGKVDYLAMLRREGKAPETESEESDEEHPEEQRRPKLREEGKLGGMERSQDEEDPMAQFLLEEKTQDLERARAKEERREKKRKRRDHHRHDHRHHRPRVRGQHVDEGGSDREQERKRSRTEDRSEDGNVIEPRDPHQAGPERVQREKGGKLRDGGDRKEVNMHGDRGRRRDERRNIDRSHGDR